MTSPFSNLPVRRYKKPNLCKTPCTASSSSQAPARTGILSRLLGQSPLGIGFQYQAPTSTGSPLEMGIATIASPSETLRLNAADLINLENAFNSGRGMRGGIPIYAGFPSMPGRRDTNPAAPALGWVTSLSRRGSVLSLQPQWGMPGRIEIENGSFRLWAPLCLFKSEKGARVPVEIVAVGLTNEPSPFLQIAAENDGASTRSGMRSAAVSKALASLSKALPANCRYDAAWTIAASKNPELFQK